MSGFDIDPDNLISIFGWGVVRPRPWDFVGLLVTSDEAHRKREEMGSGYVVRHDVR